MSGPPPGPAARTRSAADVTAGRDDLWQRVYPWIAAHRRGVALSAYAGAASMAYVLAYLLRFEFAIPSAHRLVLLATLPLLVSVRIACHAGLRLSTRRWRYVGVPDVLRLVVSTLLGTMLFAGITALLDLWPPVPRSVFLIESMLTLNLTSAAWITYRLLVGDRMLRGNGGGRQRRVLVVGAGEAGSRLVREMLRGRAEYRPVGFLDDDPLKRGTHIMGLPVLGAIADLPRVAASRQVAEIFIAMASVCPAFLREVTELCTGTGLPFRILPRNAGLFDGDVSLRQLRNIRVEDLLGREPVRLELPELARDLAGRSVLITGAAGSIGSELARQVALHAPRKLVLLDQAESDLYFVELEIRERHPGLEVVPVVGDILDAERMRAVFRRHRPDRVFHAAAYKHVPLMELNIREAVQNNVLGSLRMIELAGEMEVERFVLISTDKAVRPSSVMGATKRLAELTLLAARVRYPRTSYRAVRFGNVLGSQGSVIPLFRRQIETSGVVTVTDPEVTRYFMSIPEAVQLVLQASILEEGSGRIAMLEMGEPIRILDLARNLIRLAGLREGVDVHIRITGLRPGEKLHEELVHEDEETIPTPVRSVRIVLPRAGEEDGVERLLEELRVLRHWIPSAQDGQLKEHLTRLVRSFGTRKEREPVVEPMKRMVAGGD